MSSTSSIEWTDATWNPVRGCSRVSAGCVNCYAERVAHRFSGPGRQYAGLTTNGRWNGRVVVVPKHFADPLRWKEPRRVFVNSMSDLFHDAIEDETIAAVFGVMAASPAHTFQVLTKRPARMLEWFRWIASPKASTLCFEAADRALIDAGIGLGKKIRWTLSLNVQNEWPLPNVWLGVSVENQATADERIPILLHAPAAVRFVSYEPALGPVDFGYRGAGALLVDGSGERMQPQTHAPIQVDWIIVGGESGPGARPFYVEWARGVVKACREARVACFVKQLGSRAHVGGQPFAVSRKGAAMDEWPEDLRVREFPR